VERDEFATLILHMASADLRSKVCPDTLLLDIDCHMCLCAVSPFNPQMSSPSTLPLYVLLSQCCVCVKQEVQEYWAREECGENCRLPES
jgi:hypothetical protein